MEVLHSEPAEIQRSEWCEARSMLENAEYLPPSCRALQKPAHKTQNTGLFPRPVFLQGYLLYALYKKVTICALVQPLLGLKVESVVPLVTPFSTAQATASA